MRTVMATRRRRTRSENDRDLPQLPYREGVVYGPVQSRRLGRSLGVNLLAAGPKCCQWDCVYCQFPAVPQGFDWRARIRLLPRGDLLLKAIAEGILRAVKDGKQFDWITLSGNGDPSIHPDLLEVACYLRTLVRDVRLPVRLSIMTNFSGYRDARFLEALRLFDTTLIKLDAGNDEAFRRVNRPTLPVCLRDLCDAMATVGEVTIQTMLIGGRLDNRASVLSEEYAELIRRVRPVEVQLTTIDKRPACASVRPLKATDLARVKRFLSGLLAPVPVNVYYQERPSGFPESCRNDE